MFFNFTSRIKEVARILRAWWKLKSTLFSSARVTVKCQRTCGPLEPTKFATARGFHSGNGVLTFPIHNALALVLST